VNPKAELHAKDEATERPRGDLIMLGVIAPLAGLGAGLVEALFRLALQEANRFRDALIARMDVWGLGGFVLFVGLAAGAVAVAAWLVRRIAPSASGSGIPRVMAMLSVASLFLAGGAFLTKCEAPALKIVGNARNHAWTLGVHLAYLSSDYRAKCP
jgi:H+/Cl- antiporter ClcA